MHGLVSAKMQVLREMNARKNIFSRHDACDERATFKTMKPMKYNYLILAASTLLSPELAMAQAAPPVVIEETTTELVTPLPGAEVRDAQRRLDAALARERLGIAPVVLPAPAPAPAGVETTVETTTIETPGQPTRVYNTERNVVIVEGRELPYLTIPVLFVEGSAELLDAQSRLAIEDTSLAIKDVLATNPTAVFDVEGHTSTDGSDEMNLKLSADRSRRIYEELIQNYAVPTTALAAHGYGENFPAFPDGTEEQMVLDRRVLVVRVK